MDTLKKALWKKPSRVELPGAFPFDEETGKIYDVLWKAAQAENYGTAEKIGRFLMRMIVPPAEDEGMGKFHARYRESLDDPEYTDTKPTPKKSFQSPSPSKGKEETLENVSAEPENDIIEDNSWEVHDEPVVVTISKPADNVVRRGGDKKND